MWRKEEVSGLYFMEVKMNKIGIYYAYWTHDWDADFHPFIDKVAGLGFDVLEVNGGTIARMTSAERQSLKAHADDKGIVLSHCIGLPPQYDIASKDETVRKNGICLRGSGWQSQC
jgi:D-psicose/D-tagatose/L-ribulose 3-epimerase